MKEVDDKTESLKITGSEIGIFFHCKNQLT